MSVLSTQGAIMEENAFSWAVVCMRTNRRVGRVRDQSTGPKSARPSPGRFSTTRNRNHGILGVPVLRLHRVPSLAATHSRAVPESGHKLRAKNKTEQTVTAVFSLRQWSLTFSE